MRSFVQKHPFTCYYVLAFTIASLVIVWQAAYAASWLATHRAPFDFTGDLMKGTAAFHHGTVYANLISIGWVAIHRNPIYFGVFVFGGAPTISALVITTIGWGFSGLKRLFLRLKLWPSRAFRRDALIAYAVIAGFFFGYSLLNIAIIWKYQGLAAVLGCTGVWGLP